MDRLKVNGLKSIVNSLIYLHSSMDRLKAIKAEGKTEFYANLHSSMDRLKVAGALETLKVNEIYIPVWID